MKIGVVSPRWLPDFGGAEIYVERLGHRLIAARHEVFVVTASMGAADGPIQADRITMTGGGWEGWYDRVEEWIARGRFSHVIMNNPLTRGSHVGARRLYDRARANGARVGCFHYDLGRAVTTDLAYRHALSGNWPAAARATLARMRQEVAEQGVAAADEALESPMAFGPDFIISCSAWSDRFSDVLNRGARLVLRPFMPDNWRPEAVAVPRADIGFVNPLPHKGVDRLLAVMREGPSHWTYRVLGGGYGDAFTATRAALEAAAPGRVTCLDYVADMRDFYASVRVQMFASRYEGYGMAAIEPAFVGTPTVATDYPAIVEAVGESARLVAYDGTDTDWIAALGEVIADHPLWSARALDRAAIVLERQRSEFDEALAFLSEV